MLLWNLMTGIYLLLALHFLLKSFRWDSLEYSVYLTLLQPGARDLLTSARTECNNILAAPSPTFEFVSLLPQTV